jgi:large subunit ribosomal protein L19
MNEIKAIEASQMKSDLSDFRSATRVKVHFKIVEGKTSAVQAYEGLVFFDCFKNTGIGKPSPCARIRTESATEPRMFPMHSPRI